MASISLNELRATADALWNEGEHKKATDVYARILALAPCEGIALHLAVIHNPIGQHAVPLAVGESNHR